MKTKQVLFSMMLILFAVGWLAPVVAQDIPTNYIQNPNMEHELNAIFWYGDWTYRWGTNGIVSHPDDYLTNLDHHSGNWCMDIPPGWIWVSYPVRGQEEKKFKASFWFKGYMTGYWNFVYRDAGLTEQDLPPQLTEQIGADTVYHEFGGQDAMYFGFWGDDKVVRDGWTEDWTYFEFVWDWPGTIPGWGNTSMWYGQNEPAYVDDLYYGEWYDGQYSGEEPFGFINGDFEKSELNGEWLYNLAYWDAFSGNDFVSTTENHTDAGMQSLGLMDYKQVSDDGDTSLQDRNITYYMPAMGASGKNMELDFWYKGNAATMSLYFYGDYGTTTDVLPLPEGSKIILDSTFMVDIDTIDYTLDTVSVIIDSTVTYTTDIAEIDTIKMEWVDDVFQNFDNVDEIPLPISGQYSGSYYPDWAATLSDKMFYSPGKSHWLPGDPGWTGTWGELTGIEDGNTYSLSFMYRGKFALDIAIGRDLKYDLGTDPDGIVPPDATVESKDDVANGTIVWEFDADDWTKFNFTFEVDTWLADAVLASPASVWFTFRGTWTTGDNGYVDDLRWQHLATVDPPRIDTIYVVDEVEYHTTYNTVETLVTDTASTWWEYTQEGARWDLPAVTNWTEKKITWTNPSGDIGGNLTMFLDNNMLATPYYVTPENPGLDPENASWTFFDDFVYQVSTVGIDTRTVKWKGLHTYPNPAVDMIYLSLEDPISRIDIYNSLGQMVRTMNNPDRKFDVSNLSSGIYIMNVTDERGTLYRAKFMKK